MINEELYIIKRKIIAITQSMLFYLFRIIPINNNKIVFCCIEGTTGYSCNPKYIAEQCIKKNQNGETSFQLVWLVNDISKEFPKDIKVVRNTIWNRAYHLSTAHIWIDNSRKQLEVRKRKNQVYIQTWHAKLGFKPTGLDRGESFSQIAYLVSKHDSDMVDYWLSNSEWYDKTLKTGALYDGKIIKSGSPRCDILVNRSYSDKIRIRYRYNLPENVKLIMYAPTFRGGNQQINRKIEMGNHMPDFDRLIRNLENKFGGTWYILLRLHPQLAARKIKIQSYSERLLDISNEDDMYEILAGCDAFITDYSSAAFDAAVMKIPIFLYCDDYNEYEKERGKLLWDLTELPFGFSQTDKELDNVISSFDFKLYIMKLNKLIKRENILEDGKASVRIMKFIKTIYENGEIKL